MKKNLLLFLLSLLLPGLHACMVTPDINDPASVGFLSVNIDSVEWQASHVEIVYQTTNTLVIRAMDNKGSLMDLSLYNYPAAMQLPFSSSDRSAGPAALAVWSSSQPLGQWISANSSLSSLNKVSLSYRGSTGELEGHFRFVGVHNPAAYGSPRPNKTFTNGYFTVRVR